MISTVKWKSPGRYLLPADLPGFWWQPGMLAVDGEGVAHRLIRVAPGDQGQTGTAIVAVDQQVVVLRTMVLAGCRADTQDDATAACLFGYW